MPLIPIAFFGWIKSNLKWIAIIAVVAVVAFGAWRYTKLVEDYAKAEQKIVLLEQNVKDKENAIAFLQEEKKISERLIISFMEQNDKLEEDLKNITENLPSDFNDLAPESIREALKRLQDITP